MALLMAAQERRVRRPSRRRSAVPGGQPAHALQRRPGGDRAVQPHAGRRRRGRPWAATPSRPRRAVHGPGRGRRGPHPRRRRQPAAAAQRLRPVRGGQGLRRAAVPEEGVPLHRHGEGRHSRGGGARAGLPARQRRHLAQPRLPARDAKAAGAGHGAARVSVRRGRVHVPAARAQRPATIDMMLTTCSSTQICEHDRKIGQKLARGAHRRRHVSPSRARHRGAAAGAGARRRSWPVRRGEDPGPDAVHAEKGKPLRN